MEKSALEAKRQSRHNRSHSFMSRFHDKRSLERALTNAINLGKSGVLLDRRIYTEIKMLISKGYKVFRVPKTVHSHYEFGVYWEDAE